MKHWRTLITALIAAMLLPFVIELIVALIPFIGILGTALAGLIITCCVCGGIYIVALMHHKIVLMDIRRQQEYYARRITVAGTVVAYHQEDGEVRNLSAEHLQLPAPIMLEDELSAEDKEVIDRSKVLAAHFDEGKGMHTIEKELGIPYNKVRDWCNTAKALRARQQQW